MNKNERRSTLAEAYPAAVRPLRRRRPAPAALAQLAVRPVPFGAALGTPPRGEVSTAPRPHVSPQGLPVGRMRRPVSVLCVRLTAPACCGMGPGGQRAAPRLSRYFLATAASYFRQRAQVRRSGRSRLAPHRHSPAALFFANVSRRSALIRSRTGGAAFAR